jgi:signal transduction histidine kinase
VHTVSPRSLARAGRVLAAIDLLPQAIAILDRSGRFEYANESLLALVELPAEDVIGRDAHELLGDLSHLAAAPEAMLDWVRSASEHPERRQDEVLEVAEGRWYRAQWIPIDRGRLVVLGEVSAHVESERRRADRAASELIVAQERERSRLAAELHDSAVQVLAATLMRLDRARLVETLSPRLDALLRDLDGDLRATYAELRTVLFNLRPETLTKNGLVAATRQLLEQFAKETGIAWSLDHHLAHPECGQRALLAFRVLQEALFNIRKHADASTVTVSIAADGQLDLSIEDDGCGFDPKIADARLRAGHLGLATMRERVEVTGGTFELSSSPGRGTRIQFSVPELGE